MQQPDLHIISFAVPYPANYGGAIDVWNRVCALHRAGVRIKLHCFVYGKFSPHDAIREVVQDVHYYPRISWPAILAPGQPYIVSSRKNPVLLSKLQQDNAPVLFEGIHSTGFHQELKGRKRLLRSHNIEHQYYHELAMESQRFQYLFFQRESLALQRYETEFAKTFDTVFSISPNDTTWYNGKGGKSVFMPVYHGCNEMKAYEGRGKYLLYQGDLSIEPNQNGVLELLRNIPRDARYPVIIAGKSGERSFEEKLTKYPDLRREADVSEERMLELIRDAQIVLVHSKHSSGMKVKLFPALYHGKFIVANDSCLTGTPIDQELHTYKQIGEIGGTLEKVWNRPFTTIDVTERKRILSLLPSDDEKAKEIMRYL